MPFSFFCTCPRGLETLLAEELGEIAAQSRSLTVHRPIPAGVHCSGVMEDAWRINLHSRIASRVLLRIAQGAYRNEDDIYRLAHSQAWESWFDVKKNMRVDVTSIQSPLKSIEFATLRVKDGVADRFRQQNGARPSVDTKAPDVRIAVFLDARQATLYLDTSGESLFKRGWRTRTGEAPLRENLAAGLLRAAGWRPGIPLLDPMCGAGTILVEAAQISAGIPPGARRHFAFEQFHGFDVQRWQSIKNACSHQTVPTTPLLFGSDISGDMLRVTKHNLASAGIPFDIPLKQIEAQEIRPPTDTAGIILTNPPYGERIDVRGERTVDDKVVQFYQHLGTTLKQRFPGWTIFLFTADMSAPRLLRLKESRKTPFYNGPIECRLFRFDMVAGSNRKKRDDANTAD